MSAQPVDDGEEYEWRAIDKQTKKTHSRLHRLRHATGVPSHGGYPPFRRAIMSLAGLWTRIRVIHPDGIPGGLGYYYQPYSLDTTARISESGFVFAPTHRTVWDIVAVGQVERGMTWLCKPPFAMFVWARLCQRRGAMAVLRHGKDDGPKVHPFMRFLYGRWSFHDFSEYKDRVLLNLEMGIPVVNFPQATRQADVSRVQAAKAGAAMMARVADVPLIPAAVVGGTGKAGGPERFVHYRTGRVLRREPSRLDRLRYRRLVLIVVGKPIPVIGVTPDIMPREVIDIDAQTMRLWDEDVAALDAEGESILKAL